MDNSPAPSSKQSQFNLKFDPDAYLTGSYNPDTVSPLKRDVPLKEIHQLFKTKELHSAADQLKVLDYGCGPSVQHTISAAGYKSDIVFAEYTERNRLAIRRWLDKDPTAFNWSPYFDYVVQTLEGRNESDAREREEQLRRAVSGVVDCDITQDHPIEMGYEGPYDIIITACCLESACETPEGYTTAVAKLMSLLKPGGVMAVYGIEREDDGLLSQYSFAGEVFHDLVLKNDFVKATFTQAGLRNIRLNCYPGRMALSDSSMLGTFFLSGTKEIHS